MAGPTPDQIAAMLRLQSRRRLLGRFSGPEFFFAQGFAISTSPIFPNRVPISEALESLLLEFSGRAVIGTANFTTIGAEAPQNLITRILITGVGDAFGQQTLLDMSGATLWAWLRCFQIRGNSLYGCPTAGTRVADPSVPFGMTLANFGNTATYDIRFNIKVPLTPCVGPSGKIDTLSYALRAEDWKQGLQVQIFFGDNTALGTPAGTSTVTWSAIGGATGTPQLNVYTNSVALGPLRKTYPSAIVLRAERQIPAGISQTGANNVVLLSLNKTRTTSILLKQGTLVSTSPASTFITLTETQLGNLQVIRDQNPIRNFQDWTALKELMGDQLNTIIPGGYNLITFVDSSKLDAMLADNIQAASRFDLLANVLTTGNTQLMTVTQEQVLGDPQNRIPGTPV